MKKLSPIKLNELVKEKSCSGLGGFVDLNNDLGLMVEGRSNLDPEIFMPYFYARRCAAAGMLSQGAIDKEAFDTVEKLFFNFMAQVGTQLTKDEQIEFQEGSLDRALELMSKYLVGVTRKSTSLLIASAKQDVSLRNTLIDALDQGQDDLEKIVEPVMYGNWIMKSEFCMGFFSSGWWEPTDDSATTSRRLLKYFDSMDIRFESHAERADDVAEGLRFETFQQASEWARQDPSRAFTRSPDDSSYIPKEISSRGNEIKREEKLNPAGMGIEVESQIGTLIGIVGIEAAADIEAKLVMDKIGSTEIAYQFILEELDGASRGNSASIEYAQKSGIPAHEFKNALNNSTLEVDGPDGPQQFLLLSCLQLRENPEIMAEFRCRVGDSIMREYGFGKYASGR